RGRRDPRHLLMGDALDFWRVEAIEPGKLLRLRAEMKLPGLAWLELSVGQDYDGMTTYSQRAIFRPRGLAGHAYRRSISPFHGVVFYEFHSFAAEIGADLAPRARQVADERSRAQALIGLVRAD